MDHASILDKLDSIVNDERDAIIRMESEKLDRFTDEKLALLAALREAPRPEPALAARFDALRAGLRHNLTLLSYGRACLREALAACALGGADPLGATRPGLRIHVTG